MTRCIIHIGAHKTGSTSIQDSLDGFADDRFVYAKLDMPNHSLAMFSLFAPHPERHHIHVAHGLDARAVSAYVAARRKELERALSTARGRTLIVSGEDISVLTEEGLVAMRDYFRDRCESVTVVGYVRPPLGTMASSFQQRVKAGAVARLDFDREYRGYRKRFAKFDAVFGRENVLLWKFDPRSFPAGCAVRDFCRRLRIELPEKRIVRLNESLPREVVSFYYTYRKLGPKLGYSVMRAGEGQRLGDLLSAVFRGKFRFSPDAVRPVLEHNRADIAWMEARLGESLDEDVGARQPGDVEEESDLLRPDPDAVRTLLAQLDQGAPDGIRGKTPEEVARLFHAFRSRHARRGTVLEGGAAHADPEPGWNRIKGLVEEMRRANPELLENVTDEAATAVVAGTFKHINKALAKMDSGSAIYPWLGRFVVRKVERTIDGKKVASTQIGFRRAEPRVPRKPGPGSKT